MKPCLVCGAPTPGSRCPQHAAERPAHKAAYNDPRYRAYRAKVRRTGPPCAECGKPGADTVGHIIPLARGGPNHPTNWQPEHATCNYSKGSR